MEDETAEGAIAARWLRFARVEGDARSPRYADWARGLAADDALLTRLAPLSRIEQQPNLVLAAMRFAGVDTRLPWPEAAAHVHERWDAIEACIRTRRTQTNEARRLATLLPAFASLPQPLALVEVGASMGLCLQPSRWSYAFEGDGGTTVVGDEGAPRLSTRLLGGTPAPRMPDVSWSAGLDLHPLSAASDDDVRWLETLIWPVGDGAPDRDRLDRLHAAVAIAREHGPTVVRGDLVTDAAALVDDARGRAATTVVFHTAVLAYVADEGRRAFAETMRTSDATWISNEGLGVGSAVRERLDALGATPDEGDFCIAIDEQPFALADAHGRWVRPLAR